MKWSKASNIVVLTGAGVSVASGIPAFRGPGGLWNEVEVADYLTSAAIARDPVKVWRFLVALRPRLASAKPNAAHQALAEFEAKLKKTQTMTLVTQNVDGLHHRAGSRNVVEIHGNLMRTLCLEPQCDRAPYIDPDASENASPVCPRCGGIRRVDVVLFDELIPTDAQRAVFGAISRCDLFIAVGTSGEVYPAAGLAATARAQGAHTVLVNLETFPSAARDFDEVHVGRAEVLLPKLL